MLQELKKKKLLESLRGKPEAKEGETITAIDPNQVLKAESCIDDEQEEKITKAKKLLGK